MAVSVNYGRRTENRNVIDLERTIKMPLSLFFQQLFLICSRSKTQLRIIIPCRQSFKNHPNGCGSSAGGGNGGVGGSVGANCLLTEQLTLVQCPKLSKNIISNHLFKHFNISQVVAAVVEKSSLIVFLLIRLSYSECF